VRRRGAPGRRLCRGLDCIADVFAIAEACESDLAAHSLMAVKPGEAPSVLVAPGVEVVR